MTRLKDTLWFVANIFLLGALSRRRERAARDAGYRNGVRDLIRLSRTRRFRRRTLSQVAMSQINAHPVQRHLPRRARRSMARHAGNAQFRRERDLPTPTSKSHWRRAMRVVNELLSARVPAAARADAALAAVAA